MINLKVAIHADYPEQRISIGGSLSETGVGRKLVEADANPTITTREIDWKVESLCGYPFKCFLDAYKVVSPNPRMAKDDEEKTAFSTQAKVVYCLYKDACWPKNAGATISSDSTNNEAEYEALIAGLRIAARMGVRNLEANVDSRLVANHVLGEYVAKEDNMVQYLDKTKSLRPGPFVDSSPVSKSYR
ncbi:reverse transcriptase domain-containing protein [Tanacetum coccineum]